MKFRTNTLFRLLLTVLFFMGYAAVTAQKQLRFSFTRYTKETGLLSNQVHTVLQDDQGYLWIGNTTGLQRFDGVRYRSFTNSGKDSTGFVTGPVVQLMRDARKRIWILFNDGRAGIWDPRRFAFTEAKINYPPNYAIKRLVADEYGNVFMQQEAAALLTYNEKANEFAEKYNFFKVPPGKNVKDFLPQPGTRRYWMSFSNGGLAMFNAATGKLSYAGNNVENEKVIERYKDLYPYHIYFDKKQRLWFQVWDGIPRITAFDMKKQEPVIEAVHFASVARGYYETEQFFEQSDGSVWVSGLKVFARFNEERKIFEHVKMVGSLERTINARDITFLYEDREHNTWVGTVNEGLYRFNTAKDYFSNIDHIHRQTGEKGDGSTLSFIQLKDGTVLAGVWGDGVYRYDKDWNEIALNIKGIPDKNNYSVWSMYPSRDSNTIWMSLQPTIGKYDQSKNSIEFYDPPKLESRTVRQIVEDTNGNLWIGMHNRGLFKWTAAKGQKNFDDGLEKISFVPDRHIAKIFCDSHGAIWVAVDGDGVYVIDANTGKLLIRFSRLAFAAIKIPDDAVSSFVELNDSIMAIGCATSVVLHNFNTGHTEPLHTQGSFAGYTASMEKDKDGNLWVATTSGLYRVDIAKRAMARFGEAEGISNDNFATASSYKMKDGRMLFGAAGTFIYFQPSDIKLATKVPHVLINDFEVNNRSLPVDSLLSKREIVLKDVESSLRINFSPMSFSNRYRLRYKMNGLDKDWQEAGNNFTAVYSYVPPGSYDFLIQAEDLDGNRGPITSVSLDVNAPIWKKWWFYNILAIAVFSFWFWLDRENIKRKEAVQKMRSAIASNLHQYVNTALGSINILSEMARIKARAEPEKSTEFIEQIHSKSSNVMIAMDDMLWSINPENDSMQKSAVRMKEHAALLSDRYNTEIEIKVDKPVEKLKLNMELRHNTFLLFRETTDALIKAGAANCSILVKTDHHMLKYVTEFDCRNCDSQTLHQALNATVIRKLVADLSARLRITEGDEFSTVTLQIPIGTN